MKLGNLRGRLALLTAAGAIDVETASNGRFAADPQAVFAKWREFRDWASAAPKGDAKPYAETDLQCPVPRPTQVFGIGLNYRAHAEEAGLPIPSGPPTFTKFPTCITGPFDDVTLPSGFVDWEVELVVVIGERAFHVGESDGWKHVAALTVGQDISERVVQWGGGGQFSLGKSFPGFGPLGPCLVTPTKLQNPDDLELGCRVGGEVHADEPHLRYDLQRSASRCRALGDSAAAARRHRIHRNPAGDVGAVRKPPRFLQPGEVIESWIEGIGTIRNRMVAGPR